MDEEVIKALTNTGEWQDYLESKRELEHTKKLIADFTETLSELEGSE